VTYERGAWVFTGSLWASGLVCSSVLVPAFAQAFYSSVVFFGAIGLIVAQVVNGIRDHRRNAIVEARTTEVRVMLERAEYERKLAAYRIVFPQSTATAYLQASYRDPGPTTPPPPSKRLD